MSIDEQKKLAAFGCFVLGFLIVAVILLTPGCASNNMPPIDVSFWAGNSSVAGVTRAQEGKTLECNDPEFDNYTCLTYADLQKIYHTMLECKQWPLLAKTKDIKRFVRKNPEVIQHVLYREGFKNVESIQH
jgi:hypothetical protein